MSYETICEDSLSVGLIINGSGEKVRCVDKHSKKALIEFKIISKQTIPASLYGTTDINSFVVDFSMKMYKFKIKLCTECVNLLIHSFRQCVSPFRQILNWYNAMLLLYISK